MNDKQCEFEKDNHKCRAYKITGSKYCFTHTQDPEIVELREKALQKAAESHKLFFPLDTNQSGALTMPKFVDLSKAKGIKKAYITLLKAAAQNLIDERKLGALIYALNGYINAIDKIDLLQRIEKLEQVAKTGR